MPFASTHALYRLSKHLSSNASLTDAIDIFDRVNSQGTKLTDAELAPTHATAKWP